MQQFVYRESLSTLTHIPLLWHKDRQGSSHSISQITIEKAEVNKVWVHLTDWLLSPFNNICPLFNQKKSLSNNSLSKWKIDGDIILYHFMWCPSFTLLYACHHLILHSFSPVLTHSSFSTNYPSSKHWHLTPWLPPHNLTLHPTHWCVSVCLSWWTCAFSSVTRIFVVLLPWWFGLFNSFVKFVINRFKRIFN